MKMERFCDTTLTNIPQSHKGAVIISDQSTSMSVKSCHMEITGRYKNIGSVVHDLKKHTRDIKDQHTIEMLSWSKKSMTV